MVIVLHNSEVVIHLGLSVILSDISICYYYLLNKNIFPSIRVK